MRCSRFWWYADEKAGERISKLLKHGQLKKVLYLQQWHIQWWDEKGFRFQTLSLRWGSKYKTTNTLNENLGCEGWYDIKISLKSPFNSHTVVIQFITGLCPSFQIGGSFDTSGLQESSYLIEKEESLLRYTMPK